MAALKDPLEGWQDYLQSLPPVYAGFSLDGESGESGLIQRIFAYRNDECRRSVTVVYDRSTVEFMLRVRVGLVEFCDVRFIHPDRDRFEAILQTSLLPLLDSLQCCIPDRMETLFRNKKLHEWDYESILPMQLHGFSRVVCPANCVQVTNGSYLIIDYSDYARKSSLRFFFNVFRDDFFAELLVLGVPEATKQFDAPNLKELESCLRSSLDSGLRDLRARI
jgi:hypothetical protein